MTDRADAGRDTLSTQERWSEIRALTDRLSRHAHDRRWEAVGELHALRDARIRDFFAQPVAAREADAVREEILALLAADSEVAALACADRSEAAAALHKLRSGRKAHKAYTDIGGRP